MKILSGTIFVAATCIGSGMIALPITLAKVGLIPSILLMLAIWFVIYYTALASVELNLQARKGLALGSLCKNFSGTKMQYFGAILLKLLSYALLSAYISGGTSIIEKILEVDNLTLWYVVGLLLILLMPSQIIQKVNNLLFLGLLATTAILILFLLISVQWKDIPLFEIDNLSQVKVWTILIPVVFTSFGFQVIFHILTDLYKGDVIALKKVFLWGSLIPAIIYIIWTVSVLIAINNNSKQFYIKMVNGNVEVGDLISQLSLIAQTELVQILIRWIAFLAISTSAIGVGLGLVGAIEQQLERFNSLSNKKVASVALSIMPSTVIILFIPGAFVSILGFAGMILSFIAILIPIYLLSNVRGTLFYKELRNKTMIIISVITGFIIIICGFLNIFLI